MRTWLNGAGKTVIMAWIITFALIREERVVAFSQTYKSLSQNLFQEVIHCFEKLNLTPEYNKTSMMMSFGKGQLFGFSYDSYESCRGLTEIRLLVLDELFLAPIDIFSVVSPVLRGDFKPVIRFGTSPRKGSPWNSWAKNGMNDGSVTVFTAAMRDNTFLSEESLQLSEKAITDENMRRQELYGEILEDSDDSAILKESDFPFLMDDNSVSYPIIVGIDGSGMGRDNASIAIRKGHRVISLTRYPRLTGMQGVSEVEKILMKNGFSTSDVYEVNIDQGYGEALYECFSQFYGNVSLIPFASKSSNASYSNKRAEMYFNLAKAVKSGLFIEDMKVKEELLATRFILDNQDRYLLIPKEEIRQIINRSPDGADSLALTYVNEDSAYDSTMTMKDKRMYSYKVMGNLDD